MITRFETNSRCYELTQKLRPGEAASTFVSIGTDGVTHLLRVEVEPFDCETAERMVAAGLLVPLRGKGVSAVEESAKAPPKSVTTSRRRSAPPITRGPLTLVVPGQRRARKRRA